MHAIAITPTSLILHKSVDTPECSGDCVYASSGRGGVVHPIRTTEK